MVQDVTVFTFVCAYCGPIKVIPMSDIRTRRAAPPSHWCPNCGSVVTAGVLYDYEPPVDAA